MCVWPLWRKTKQTTHQLSSLSLFISQLPFICLVFFPSLHRDATTPFVFFPLFPGEREDSAYTVSLLCLAFFVLSENELYNVSVISVSLSVTVGSSGLFPSFIFSSLFSQRSLLVCGCDTHTHSGVNKTSWESQSKTGQVCAGTKVV